MSLNLPVNYLVGGHMLGRWQTGKLGCVSVGSGTEHKTCIADVLRLLELFPHQSNKIIGYQNFLE